MRIILVLKEKQFQSHCDLLIKKEIMTSIFSGTSIKIINGINVIQVNDDTSILRLLNCDVAFSNNDTYDTLYSDYRYAGVQ